MGRVVVVGSSKGAGRDAIASAPQLAMQFSGQVLILIAEEMSLLGTLKESVHILKPSFGIVCRVLKV